MRVADESGVSVRRRFWGEDMVWCRVALRAGLRVLLSWSDG